MSRPTADAGFTLVEAMVSLFVFGLIAAGCVSMLMQSVTSQQRVAEAHEGLRELQTARALLAADLAQVAIRPTRDAEGAQRPSFIGGAGATGLAFVRAAAEPDAERGGDTSLLYVEYLIEDGRVLRRSRSYLDATVDTPIGERVVLEAAGDAHFVFNDGARWIEEWGAQGGQPPRAVALIAETPRYGAVRLEALVGL
ncbi:MAG: type II secretion system minor pseudopilin GspJ [Hyphomonadaceae bacterium]